MSSSFSLDELENLLNTRVDRDAAVDELKREIARLTEENKRLNIICQGLGNKVK